MTSNRSDHTAANKDRTSRKPRRVLRSVLSLGAAGALLALGGCAVYPAGYGYGYSGPPVYINGSVNYSDGHRDGRAGYGPRGGWRR